MIGIEINRTKSNEQSCQNLKIKCHTKKKNYPNQMDNLHMP